MQWTVEQLAAWCGGKVVGDGQTVVNAITFDSRKAAEGSLFIALRGDRADGHDYVAAAAQQGAVAALVERPMEVPLAQIVTEDARKAYGAMAAAYRQQLDAKVIGVTGSVGKTSTKEMTADILQSTFSTARTEGNHNNDLGLPMTILAMEEDTRMAVVEMGMNHFGEMAYLTSIASPDIAVITNIGTMHIEHLGSREGILKAKLEILQGMEKNASVVFNGDEPLLWNIRGQDKHKKYYYFGVENDQCDVLAEKIEQMDGGMSFWVKGLGRRFEVFVPVEGIHAVYNALAAITVGLLCEVSEEKIQYQLAHFRNTGMRQEVLNHKGMTILADCYNAGPESMAAALSVLGDHPTKGRRIAVLGDMLELGNRSMAEHYRIGRMAVEKADYIFAYGSHTDRLITGAVTGGMDPKKCLHFDTHEAMARTLATVAQAGDVLLFKGSRGMKMENVLRLFTEQTKERDNA